MSSERRPSPPAFNRPETTGQAPIFSEKAVEIARRLEGDDGDEARAIRAEALALEGFFNRWKIEHPTNEDRVAAIMKLMDLSRRAMEYASRSHR